MCTAHPHPSCFVSLSQGVKLCRACCICSPASATAACTSESKPGRGRAASTSQSYNSPGSSECSARRERVPTGDWLLLHSLGQRRRGLRCCWTLPIRRSASAYWLGAKRRRQLQTVAWEGEGPLDHLGFKGEDHWITAELLKGFKLNWKEIREVGDASDDVDTPFGWRRHGMLFSGDGATFQWYFTEGRTF